MQQAVVIREAREDDADAIASVHVASWQQHYRGMLDDEEIAKRTLESRRTIWRDSLRKDGRITFVAELEAEIVGFSSVLILDPPVDGFAAYLQTLYLLAEVKRRGLGRALLARTAGALLQHGCNNLALRVLRLNPARAFYERLGARLVSSGIRVDEGRFDDVVYAFDRRALERLLPTQTV